MTTDVTERTIAAGLEVERPGWTVWWGPWSRRYWGIFAATGATLSADTWEALDRAMRDATALYATAIGAVQ